MQVTEQLRQKLLLVFPISADQYYVVDSLPLHVCKFEHTRFCRSFLADGANYGKYPSNKVQALITPEEYITAFEITPASIDDREGLRDFAEDHLNLVILGYKGYTGAAFRRYALKVYALCR